MKKHRKPEESTARYVPAEDLARKNISSGLLQLAQVVDLQRCQLDFILTINGTRAISGKEEQFLQEAREKLMRAEQICRVIGERNARS